MKIPICAFCAQTGMLCKDCERKLAQGEITQTDVEVAKVAVEFEKQHPEASKVNILETIERPNQIIILVTPGHARFLVDGGLDFDKKLEKKLMKPVRILEKEKDKRRMIDAIFSPAVISGINTVFVPMRSGKPGKSTVDEEMIVVLAKSEKERLPASQDELKDLVKLLVGEEIRIDFR